MEVKKRKIGIVSIVIIAILIVLLGIGVGYSMVWNQSPKMMYLKAEAYTWEENKNQFIKDYGDAFDFLKEMYHADAVTREENLSVDFDIENADEDVLLKKIQDEINRLSFQMVSSSNQKDKSHYYHLQFLQDNQSFINLELHQSPEYTALQMKEIYEPVLKLKNDRFGDLIRKFDSTYTGTDSLYVEPIDYQEYILTTEESRYLKEKYGKLLNEELKGEYFTITKDALRLEKDGEAHMLDQLSLKLSEEQVQEILTKLLTEMKTDEKLYSMLESRFLSLATLVDGNITLTSEDIRQGYDIVFKELLAGVDAIYLSNGLVSNLYINGDNYVEKREVIIEGSDTKVVLSMTSMPMKNSQEWTAMNLEATNETGSIFNVGFDEMRVGKGKKFTVDGMLEFNSSLANIVVDYDGLQEGKNLKANYDVRGLQNGEEIISINGTVDTTIVYKQGETNQIRATAYIKTPLQNVGLGLNYDYKTIFSDAGETFSKESLNGRDVLTIEAEEWMNIQEEVINNALNIPGKIGLMGAVELPY